MIINCIKRLPNCWCIKKYLASINWTIMISIYILTYLGLTKIFELPFIVCYNFQLESYWMVMIMSVCALSWHDDVCACTVMIFIPYSLHEFRRSHFLLYGYGTFPSLHRTISYLMTMSVYDLFISGSFNSVSLLYLIPSLFYPTLTTFTTTIYLPTIKFKR